MANLRFVTPEGGNPRVLPVFQISAVTLSAKLFITGPIITLTVNNVNRYDSAADARTPCYIRWTRVPERSPTEDCPHRPDGAQSAQLRGPQCAVCGATARTGRIPRFERADRVSDQR